MLSGYNYSSMFEELYDVAQTLQLEGDKEEVKEETRIKTLAAHKILTRLTVLIAQTKAGNNLY